MSDGFIVVKSRRKPNKKATFVTNIERPIVELAKIGADNLLASLAEVTSNLRKSKFLAAAVSDICNPIDEILCLGLGNFSNSYASKIQLGALLYFKSYFNCPVTIYDPVFSQGEKHILEKLEIKILKENLEGRIKVLSQNILAYFPHCPKQLVNNFLWANWGPKLLNCVLISNRFSTILTNNTQHSLESIACIRDIFSIVNEVPFLDFDDEFPNVFNDLAILTFNSHKVTANFWEPKPKPNYFCDIEFITSDERIIVKEL